MPKKLCIDNRAQSWLTSMKAQFNHNFKPFIALPSAQSKAHSTTICHVDTLDLL